MSRTFVKGFFLTSKTFMESLKVSSNSEKHHKLLRDLRLNYEELDNRHWIWKDNWWCQVIACISAPRSVISRIMEWIQCRIWSGLSGSHNVLCKRVSYCMRVLFTLPAFSQPFIITPSSLCALQSYSYMSCCHVLFCSSWKYHLTSLVTGLRYNQHCFWLGCAEDITVLFTTPHKVLGW